MKIHKRPITASVLLFAALLACNMPGGEVNGSQPDLAGTITAQAQLIALQSSPMITSVPLTPIFTATSTSTPFPSETPTVTPTFTPSVPMLTASQDTNCRSGPAKFYDYLGALLIGENAEVVGKNSETNYWIIKNPDGVGTCWLWGRYVTVSGDTAGLPEIAIPPTPTPAPPAMPKNLSANKICFLVPGPAYQLGGSISWEDVANEEGYNLYVNPGVLYASIGADVTTGPLPNGILPPGGTAMISVEAFNAAGKSKPAKYNITCP